MAISFASSGDRIVRNSGTLLNYNSAYTWMGWINISDTAANRAMFAIGTDSFFANYDEFRAAFGGAECKNNVGGTSTGSTFSASTWYHVACVRESATSQKLYVGGSLVTTDTNNVGTARSAVSRIEAGGFTTSDIDQFAGSIAVMKAWTVALTLAEVQAEKDVQAPVKTASLYGYWPTYTDGTAVNDYSGNGFHWSSTGTPTLTATQPPGFASSPPGGSPPPSLFCPRMPLALLAR